MISVNFQDNSLEKLKAEITKQNEQCIDGALNLMVEEIFQKYSSSGEELTFEEWCNWFTDLDGINEILDHRKMYVAPVVY